MKPLRPGGHPLHPAVVHAPMGLWLSVPAWDLLATGTGRGGFWAVSFWCLVGGLAGALAAVATGLPEAAALVSTPESEKALERHWMLAVAAAAAFVASAALRGGDAPPGALRAWAVLSSLLGATLLGAAGWFGGELVVRHGAGREKT